MPSSDANVSQLDPEPLRPALLSVQSVRSLSWSKKRSLEVDRRSPNEYRPQIIVQCTQKLSLRKPASEVSALEKPRSDSGWREARSGRRRPPRGAGIRPLSTKRRRGRQAHDRQRTALVGSNGFGLNFAVLPAEVIEQHRRVQVIVARVPNVEFERELFARVNR
jgi:hypothetical protein